MNLGVITLLFRYLRHIIFLFNVVIMFFPHLIIFIGFVNAFSASFPAIMAAFEK
jgi:hypothetical protein